MFLIEHIGKTLLLSALVPLPERLLFDPLEFYKYRRCHIENYKLLALFFQQIEDTGKFYLN